VVGLKERGFDIRLISLGGEPLHGTDSFCLPRKGRWSYFRQAGTAVRLAREFKPDLVHVHYAGGFGYWGTRCDFAPVLVSVWGADVVDLPRNPIQRFFIRRTLKRADRISATSEFLKQVSANLIPGVEQKISVIPFGVTVPDSVTPIPPPPARLCFIKAHRRKYGPDILLRAFAQVREQLPEIHLTMAGEGELTPELKRIASELGVERDVDFVGFVPNQRIYSLLQQHHMMVMPSVMESESFGVAVLEASACARPVIASRVGGVSEVLKDGRTGLLLPAGDVETLAVAIIKLAQDRNMCERMGNAGREFVRTNYRWELSLDLMSSLYERLIHGKE